MSDIERVMARVEFEPNTGCWLWPGAQTRGGYGMAKVNGTVRTVHRATFERANGAIPSGYLVCHRCDTPACVNPDHLFLGTNADNARDRERKGRGNQASGEASGPAKLTRLQVVNARRALESGETQASVARRMGVSHHTINAIAHRRTWASLEGS